MDKIKCVMKIGELPLHLYQITAGYKMLSDLGYIDLKLERIKTKTEQLPFNMMEVIINNEIRLIYDLNDGYDNLLDESQDYIEFMENLLSSCDFFFKRSFSNYYNSKIKFNEKIYPLGLNYMVTTQGNISHFPTPLDPRLEKIKKFIRFFPFSQHSNRNYYYEKFEQIPLKVNNPQILFMARLWDSVGDYKGHITKSKSDERQYINSVRADCIRKCRREFGNLFFGGISASEFSLKYYKDLVIEDKEITKRNNYLNVVKKSSICIATMGLHESTGWKLTEYVAASKAIVSEELRYEVPGDFSEEENYLTFKSSDQCLNQISRLIIDENLRYKIMQNNHEYYNEYVRPDKIVLKSLETVFKREMREEFHGKNTNSIYSYL